jgi:transcriptional regulator with PAS, ATPase and Fis domain
MNSSSWKADYTFADILGNSEPLRQAVHLAQRAAAADFPTILVGESGTGKELLAHAIHNGSARRAAPFVAVNCGTLCGDIAVAELCGYVPGAFTGADRQAHVGFLDAARGGTLFLDELQDMPPTPQSVLLRFLETGTFVRVGGTTPVQSDLRVIAASNVQINEMISRNLIRSDLLYRLNCLVIEIAPLRERRSDVRPIAEKCLRQDLHYLGAVDEGVWRALESCPHSWPGNAREVRNILLKTILLSSNDSLIPADLPRELWTLAAAASTESGHPTSNGRAPNGNGNHLNGNGISGDDPGLVALKAVLKASDHNVSEAARRLGIHRSTIYRRLGPLAK